MGKSGFCFSQWEHRTKLRCLASVHHLQDILTDMKVFQLSKKEKDAAVNILPNLEIETYTIILHDYTNQNTHQNWFIWAQFLMANTSCHAVSKGGKVEWHKNWASTPCSLEFVLFISLSLSHCGSSLRLHVIETARPRGGGGAHVLCSCDVVLLHIAWEGSLFIDCCFVFTLT